MAKRKCYFEARKDLFEGLNLAQMETEWIKHPVLRFDMSSLKNKNIAELNQTLNNLLYRYESVYGASPVETSFGGRLEYLIHNAYAQTGPKVLGTGFSVSPEVALALGRADAIIETADYVYVIEYKVDKSVDVSLPQIEDRGYATPYLSDPRKLVRVGMNFSSELRGLESWKVI